MDFWRREERHGSGDVAQLVERRTGTPLRQVRFPGTARVSLPESTLSVESLTVSVKPPVQFHALTSVRTINIPIFGSHTFVWTYENTA